MRALGVGLSGRATGDDVTSAIRAVLVEAGWRWDDVDVVATRHRLAGDARLCGLGKPVAAFDDGALSAAPLPAEPRPRPGTEPRPRPGTEPRRHPGVPPVAEAAALLAAGDGSCLVVPKRTGRYVTVAAAAGDGP